MNTVGALDARLASKIKLEGIRSQEYHRYHEVVTVGFDEVMAGDGGRVDVVLSEGPDESLQEGKESMKGQSLFRHVGW